MTTHENFLTTAESVIRCRELPRESAEPLKTLISVPLFHVTGCNSQMVTQARIGGTSVVMPRFEPATFLHAIEQHRISLLTSVPTIYELVLHHPDSVGFASPVDDLRIDRPSERGVGELLIRGPNVVAGYWRDEQRTAETFVEGWLHTGDMATLTDGMVRIVDRAKDMINRGGE